MSSLNLDLAAMEGPTSYSASTSANGLSLEHLNQRPIPTSGRLRCQISRQSGNLVAKQPTPMLPSNNGISPDMSVYLQGSNELCDSNLKRPPRRSQHRAGRLGSLRRIPYSVREFRCTDELSGRETKLIKQRSSRTSHATQDTVMVRKNPIAHSCSFRHRDQPDRRRFCANGHTSSV